MADDAGDGRFRPVRAGIINLWDYRDEEFVFADGRLVLRGPNGSGKTKALEVLFPFALDGRIEPRRLNPFASEERTMKSNLLYRGQDSAYSYVWLEFGPADPTADAASVTVGVGLRAQRHNEKVSRWYFVADGRAGVDFSLLGADDRPLTKKQLGAEVGADAIKDSPAEHRAAVDARLFGLGTQRYEQMLTLVLTLRRPQLAKNLDPKSLSHTLSDGLRPLDDELITEAARSFDDMESVQRTLTSLVRADEAADAFLASYTTYLRTHARAATDAVAARLDQVEAGRTRLATTLRERAEATERKERLEREVTEVDGALGTHRAHLESLKRSTAYSDREQLGKQAELVDQLGAAARRAQAQAAQTQRTAESRASELATARVGLDDARQAVTRKAAEVAEAAADSGVAWTAAEADDTDAGFANRVAAKAEARADDVAALRRAITARTEARRARETAEQTFAKTQTAVAAAESVEQAASERVEQARATVREELDAWWSRHEPTLTELDLPATHEQLSATLDTLGEPDAPSPASTLEGLLVEPRRDRDRVLHELGTRAERNREQLAELRGQRELISAERDDAPPAFAGRTDDRDARAGAPLWRLVRFPDDLDGERAAAIEAALHAANLLDAWVSPAETAEDPGSDAYLVPLPNELRPTGRTLAEVLRAEEDTPVATERIEAVLASVALLERGEQPARTAAPSVSAGGGFAQGVQLGAHTKAAAEYVGATARARRRKARLERLDADIAETQEVIDRLEREIAAVSGLLAALEAATRELPATAPIVSALREHGDAVVALRVHRQAADDARAELDRAIAEVGAAERALTKLAAERAMPAEPGEVDAIETALERFRRDAERLASARAGATSAQQRVDERERWLKQAQATATEHSEAAEQASTEHNQQAEELATLRDAVGADAEQVDADIARTRAAIEDADTRLRTARREHDDAVDAAGQAKSNVAGAREALRTAVAEAQADARALAPYSKPEMLGLLRVSSAPAWPGASQDWPDPDELAATAERDLADTPETPVAALPGSVGELHTAIAAATSELRPSESSLKSSKTKVSTALKELENQLAEAGHDYRPEWESADDVIVVRVADEQGFAPIGEFAQRISSQRRDQEQLLTESERKILEDALLGRLAQQIHERTIDARDLIGQMNTEMRKRRMSSGATVGVRWALADSLDDEQRAVCKLTEKDASQLGPDELARMRGHFAGQIKTARASHPDRAYADLLAEVLDYRRWRTFAFALVGSDGNEERLTKARHSTLSGGEQSVSLHLPLLAAAHVTFSSARAGCPRLIALDEAFAGVDDPGRRELLGLTAQFDLDLFMTGYDLWAAYATVPACAHYDLSHSATEHTVSPVLLLWDGAQTLPESANESLAARLGSPGTRRRRAADGDMLPGADE